LINRSTDNVTVVMVAFKNLKRLFYGSRKNNVKPILDGKK